MRHSPNHKRSDEVDPAAIAAVEAARAEQAHVNRLWPRVNWAADTLARERETNNFAQRISRALGNTGTTTT